MCEQAAGINGGVIVEMWGSRTLGLWVMWVMSFMWFMVRREREEEWGRRRSKEQVGRRSKGGGGGRRRRKKEFVRYIHDHQN